MRKSNLICFKALLYFAPGYAQEVTRRANIVGNSADGECAIEVAVDGSAGSGNSRQHGSVAKPRRTTRKVVAKGTPSTASGAASNWWNSASKQCRAP